MVRRRELTSQVRARSQSPIRPRPDIESGAGVAVALLGEDVHHAPIDAAEAAVERFLIRAAGGWRRTGVRVNPDSRKLFRLASGIDLAVKEVRHAVVVKLDRDHRADLFDKLDVLDQQQIISVGDAESADFGRPDVAQVQQLRHCVGAKPQHSIARLAARLLLLLSLRFVGGCNHRRFLR